MKAVLSSVAERAFAPAQFFGAASAFESVAYNGQVGRDASRGELRRTDRLRPAVFAVYAECCCHSIEPNHALQRTTPSRSCFSFTVCSAWSLSLIR